jgi:fluoride exporter
MIGLYVALAGSGGAVSRFMLDGQIRTKFNRTFPWATFLINASGSFILGLVSGILLKHKSMTFFEGVIGTGFCGGYTTFSTASFETVRLLEKHRYDSALLNTLGLLGITIIGAAIGIVLGEML